MTFRPSILASLVLGLLAAGFAGLGTWQLQRADWKAELMESYETAPQLELGTALQRSATFAQVTGRGYFMADVSIFLDNQVHQGQLGVHVFTPFVYTNDHAVLVNRGWMPLPRPRVKLELPPAPADKIEIQGRLREPPRPGLYLGEADSLDPDTWPQLVTYLDTKKAENALGLEVADSVMQLQADSPYGFEARDWPIVNFGPERHLGYAWTWFTMVLTIFLIWIILGVMRGRRQ